MGIHSRFIGLIAAQLIFGIRSAIAIFQPRHVVELGSGYYQIISPREGKPPVLHPGNYVNTITGLKPELRSLAFQLDLQL